MSQGQQKQFSYNKKLLDNMSTIVNYMETSRQDLLSAVKVLLTAYKNEFEQNQSLQDDLNKLKQENSLVEMSRNKVEMDLLRIKEAYNKELLKNDELCQLWKTIKSKLSEIQDNIEQFACNDQQRQCVNDLLNFVLEFGNKVTLSSSNVKCSPLLVRSSTHNQQQTLISPNKTLTNESESSTQMTTPETANNGNPLIVETSKPIEINRQSCTSRSSNNREHDFELVKNKLRFHYCTLCKNAILPLVNYYCCLKCEAQIDKNCYNKKIIFCCVRKVSRTIKLVNLLPQSDASKVPTILVKCCEQIETRAAECRALYQEKHIKQTATVLDKYLMESNANLIKTHKQSVATLCAIVIEFFKRLDEPLVQSNKWKDFARACDQTNEEERTTLLHSLVEQLEIWNRQTLAYMVLHLNSLLTKNYCNNLNKQLLVNIFGPLLIKGIDLKSFSKHDQVKLINIQKQILNSLLDVSKEFWKSILDNNRVRASCRYGRRKSTSYGHVLAANKLRVSICDQINDTMY